MNLLGFYIGFHDSNLAIYDGKVRYFKSERLYQEKHHHASLKWIEDTCAAVHFMPDAVAFSDGNRNELGICENGQLAQTVKPFRFLGKKVPTFCVDHHFAHILSAWPVGSVANIEYGIAIDGRGDHSSRVTVVHNPGSKNPVAILQSQEFALCRLFNLVGQHMGLVGLELDFAGKIMGAHAYGKVDDTFVQNNHNEKVLRNPLMLLDEIPWRGGIPTRQQNFFRFELETFRDWLASVHRLLGMFIHDIFARYIPFHATVVYGGGAALNTVFNEELYNAFRNLIIPPHCYDGGLSLGCLEFLRIQYGMQEFSTRGFPFWQYDPHGGFAEMPTIMRVVEHLKNGKIVGWFQGKGEIGPRALGHRSILYNPRQTNGKDYLNQRVKKREHWRPYAPSILASHLHEFVVCPLQSPYMLRTVAVRSEAIETMPAVVHVDGTSRVQTVDESDPELRSFHDLLAVWREITGCPGLLNTSMNAAGGPIISTPEQAIQLWRRSPLDVLCVGDQLWEK